MPLLLVVDDNERDLERFTSLGQRAGLQVMVFREGEAALRVVEDRATDIAAAIVLWELPGKVSGPQVLSALRTRKPEIPTIAVTSSLSVHLVARARALGAKDCLLKPLDGKSVARVLQGTLTTPSPPDPIFLSLRQRIVGDSEALLAALRSLARAIFHTSAKILLIGESGTGKELFARAVHELGQGSERPWIAVNVAAIPDGLLESALFGHEAGAFTDAKTKNIGYFEEAAEGTLFLDELGDLNLGLQAKVLRAIEERTFRRVGGQADIEFRARLVCATSRNLAYEVAHRRFRNDLYFRISEYEVRIPPLRERGDDLLLLAEYFIQKHARGAGRRLDRETLAILKSHPFTGNVRELQRVIERALMEADGPSIRPMDLPVEIMQDTTANPEASQHLVWPEDLFRQCHTDAITWIEHEFDREYLRKCLRDAGGKVVRAAKRAGMDPKTFRRKWADSGLPPLSAQREDEE